MEPKQVQGADQELSFPDVEFTVYRLPTWRCQDPVGPVVQEIGLCWRYKSGHLRHRNTNSV